MARILFSHKADVWLVTYMLIIKQDRIYIFSKTFASSSLYFNTFFLSFRLSIFDSFFAFIRTFFFPLSFQPKCCSMLFQCVVH